MLRLKLDSAHQLPQDGGRKMRDFCKNEMGGGESRLPRFFCLQTPTLDVSVCRRIYTRLDTFHADSLGNPFTNNVALRYDVDSCSGQGGNQNTRSGNK